jgi:RecQ-mediated genome instability protein 1
MAANIAAELTQHLNAKALYPTAAWLQGFISTVRPNTPLPAIKQTALFRLLATDITTTLNQPPASAFPPNILNGASASTIVHGPIICQVMDIEDIGHSRWSQVEAIEAKERGEMTKGREIVRVVEQDDDEGRTQAARPEQQSKGPFKLLLQDAAGLRIYGLDLRGIEGLNMNMSLGLKLLIKDVDVRRAVVLLEPSNVQILGGKIENLDKAWKDGLKGRLQEAAKPSDATETT